MKQIKNLSQRGPRSNVVPPKYALHHHKTSHSGNISEFVTTATSSHHLCHVYFNHWNVSVILKIIVQLLKYCLFTSYILNENPSILHVSIYATDNFHLQHFLDDSI